MQRSPVEVADGGDRFGDPCTRGHATRAPTRRQNDTTFESWATCPTTLMATVRISFSGNDEAIPEVQLTQLSQ
jgi:hypothetical protein